MQYSTSSKLCCITDVRLNCTVYQSVWAEMPEGWRRVHTTSMVRGPDQLRIFLARKKRKLAWTSSVRFVCLEPWVRTPISDAIFNAFQVSRGKLRLRDTRSNKSIVAPPRSATLLNRPTKISFRWSYAIEWPGRSLFKDMMNMCLHIDAAYPCTDALRRMTSTQNGSQTNRELKI